VNDFPAALVLIETTPPPSSSAMSGVQNPVDAVLPVSAIHCVVGLEKTKSTLAVAMVAPAGGWL
jgi:hypothetical protein